MYKRQTDKYALNKTKTKLVRGLAKWRRKTVDFADDIFMDVAVAFGAPDTRPKIEKKKKEEEQKAPSVSYTHLKCVHQSGFYRGVYGNSHLIPPAGLSLQFLLCVPVFRERARQKRARYVDSVPTVFPYGFHN